MRFTDLLTRRTELLHRVRVQRMLRGLQRQLTRAGLSTAYIVDSKAIACRIEDVLFEYSIGDYGATGNVDYFEHVESETRSFLYSAIGSTDTFYDVGAHGGLYSLTLLRRLGEGRIISFEPLPDELLRNFALNNHPILDVHAVALGEESGSSWITTSNRAANHLIDTQQEATRRVDIVVLDEYTERHSLPPPHWIKVDVEGMELSVLRGAAEVLEKYAPVVICEINHLYNRYRSTLPELPRFMRERGYQMYRLTGGELLPVQNPLRVEKPADLGPSADNNYWFVPVNHRLVPCAI